jgi:hypothetical protein
MTTAQLEVVNRHRELYRLWTTEYLPEVERGMTQKQCHEALAKRLNMKRRVVAMSIRRWELKGEARCIGKRLDVTSRNKCPSV